MGTRRRMQSRMKRCAAEGGGAVGAAGDVASCEAMNEGAVTQEHAYDIVGRKVGKSARTIRRIVTGN